MRASWPVIAILAAACAHVDGGVEVAWSACAVTERDGHDVDDGGVDVAAILRRGSVERLDIGNYPGTCAREPGALTRLVCHDPHVDIRYVLQWSRPTPETLLLERLEYEISSEDGVPDPTTPRSRQVLRRLAIAATTRVTVGQPVPCRR